MKTRLIRSQRFKGSQIQHLCFSGEHIQTDGSDAPDGFIVVDMPKDEFKEKYPNATETNWESAGFGDGWSDEHTVKVCEYFHKEKEPNIIHLLSDGTTIDDETYQDCRKKPASSP